MMMLTGSHHDPMSVLLALVCAFSTVHVVPIQGKLAGVVMWH